MMTQQIYLQQVHRHTHGNQKVIRRIAALTNGKAKKMVRDELQLEAEGEFPALWHDTKHEEDGSDKEYICVDKPEANTSANEIDFGSYFKSGMNAGARALREAMSALHESEFEAIDDVSGAVLDESKVRQARAVEMEFFVRMGVYTRVLKSEAKKSGVGNSSRAGGWT